MALPLQTRVSPVPVQSNWLLKPRQDFAVHRTIQYCSSKCMLLCHGVGSGKTITSLAIALNSFKYTGVKATPGMAKRVIVICPGGIFENFRKDVLDFSNAGILDVANISPIGNDKTSGNELASPQYFTASNMYGSENTVHFHGYKYSDFYNLWLNDPAQLTSSKVVEIANKMKNAVVIFDEAHRLLRPQKPGTKDTYLDLLSINNPFIPRTIDNEIISPIRTIFMTGTPYDSKFEEIFKFLKFFSVIDNPESTIFSNLNRFKPLLPTKTTFSMLGMLISIGNMMPSAFSHLFFKDIPWLHTYYKKFRYGKSGKRLFHRMPKFSLQDKMREQQLQLLGHQIEQWEALTPLKNEQDLKIQVDNEIVLMMASLGITVLPTLIAKALSVAHLIGDPTVSGVYWLIVGGIAGVTAGIGAYKRVRRYRGRGGGFTKEAAFKFFNLNPAANFEEIRSAYFSFIEKEKDTSKLQKIQEAYDTIFELDFENEENLPQLSQEELNAMFEEEQLIAEMFKTQFNDEYLKAQDKFAMYTYAFVTSKQFHDFCIKHEQEMATAFSVLKNEDDMYDLRYQCIIDFKENKYNLCKSPISMMQTLIEDAEQLTNTQKILMPVDLIERPAVIENNEDDNNEDENNEDENNEPNAFTVSSGLVGNSNKTWLPQIGNVYLPYQNMHGFSTVNYSGPQTTWFDQTQHPVTPSINLSNFNKYKPSYTTFSTAAWNDKTNPSNHVDASGVRVFIGNNNIGVRHETSLMNKNQQLQYYNEMKEKAIYELNLMFYDKSNFEMDESPFLDLVRLRPFVNKYINTEFQKHYKEQQLLQLKNSGGEQAVLQNQGGGVRLGVAALGAATALGLGGLAHDYMSGPAYTSSSRNVVTQDHWKMPGQWGNYGMAQVTPKLKTRYNVAKNFVKKTLKSAKDAPQKIKNMSVSARNSVLNYGKSIYNSSISMAKGVPSLVMAHPFIAALPIYVLIGAVRSRFFDRKKTEGFGTLLRKWWVKDKGYTDLWDYQAVFYAAKPYISFISNDMKDINPLFQGIHVRKPEGSPTTYNYYPGYNKLTLEDIKTLGQGIFSESTKGTYPKKEVRYHFVEYTPEQIKFLDDLTKATFIERTWLKNVDYIKNIQVDDCKNPVLRMVGNFSPGYLQYKAIPNGDYSKYVLRKYPVNALVFNELNGETIDDVRGHIASKVRDALSGGSNDNKIVRDRIYSDFACPKFKMILLQLILMKCGYLFDNQAGIKEHAHYMRGDNLNDTIEIENTKVLIPSVTYRDATHYFLPFVYSTSEIMGLNNFGAFLEMYGLKYKIYHEFSKDTTLDKKVLHTSYPLINPAQRAKIAKAIADVHASLNVQADTRVFDGLLNSLLELEEIRNFPICALLHPFKTEGIDGAYNPAIILMEPPNTFNDYEQLCGRVLRTYKSGGFEKSKLPVKFVFQFAAFNQIQLHELIGQRFSEIKENDGKRVFFEGSGEVNDALFQAGEGLKIKHIDYFKPSHIKILIDFINPKLIARTKAGVDIDFSRPEFRLANADKQNILDAIDNLVVAKTINATLREKLFSIKRAVMNNASVTYDEAFGFKEILLRWMSKFPSFLSGNYNDDLANYNLLVNNKLKMMHYDALKLNSFAGQRARLIDMAGEENQAKARQELGGEAAPESMIEKYIREITMLESNASSPDLTHIQFLVSNEYIIQKFLKLSLDHEDTPGNSAIEIDTSYECTNSAPYLRRMPWCNSLLNINNLDYNHPERCMRPDDVRIMGDIRGSKNAFKAKLTEVDTLLKAQKTSLNTLLKRNNVADANKTAAKTRYENRNFITTVEGYTNAYKTYGSQMDLALIKNVGTKEPIVHHRYQAPAPAPPPPAAAAAAPAPQPQVQHQPPAASTRSSGKKPIPGLIGGKYKTHKYKGRRQNGRKIRKTIKSKQKAKK